MTNTFLPFSKPTIDEATIASVGEVLRSGWITSGPKVQEFEKQLSAYFGGRPVRTFNSGTCTMEIALRIAGIGPGDEVITTPISWVATANVIIEVGATPVFADIDPVTRNIDLDKLEAAITPKTRAVIPVYLAGKPVDMDRLYAIAAKHKLRVIEDAAQAIGSTWKGKPIGSFGDFVSFSFQANKNITTSEGGCLVLNNEAEAVLAEKYRLQGVTRSGWDGIEVDVLGGKFNMTDIAAAIGLGQFAKLNDITAQRRKLAKHYFVTLGSDFEAADRRATAAAGFRIDQLAPVPGRAAGAHHPSRVHGKDESAQHRRRLPLRADPPVQAVSRAGLQGRHVPGRRTRRQADRLAADVLCDERGGCSAHLCGDARSVGCVF